MELRNYNTVKGSTCSMKGFNMPNEKINTLNEGIQIVYIGTNVFSTLLNWFLLLSLINIDTN